MNTWIPLWTSTVDSTLWEEPPHVRVMFLTLLMLRDPDHVVRQPFRRVVKKANLHEDLEQSVQLAKDALRILSEPDARSVDHQEFEGRRIKQTADGWLVLNGAKYDEEMRILTARMRKTRKQRERRQELRQRSGATMAERAIDSAKTEEERLRAEELAQNLPKGALGSFGPEAQEVVRAKMAAEAQSPQEESRSRSDGGVDDSDMPDPDAP